MSLVDGNTCGLQKKQNRVWKESMEAQIPRERELSRKRRIQTRIREVERRINGKNRCRLSDRAGKTKREQNNTI
jgi:hypothetical protein